MSFHGCHATEANLFVIGDIENRQARQLVFAATKPTNASIPDTAQCLFTGCLSWGGTRNPFLCGLPEEVVLALTDEPELCALANLVVMEADQNRCGTEMVISLVARAMMVRFFRSMIEKGEAATGVLAGLGDRRLKHAIVAMHDAPGHNWTIEALAALGGLSASRFAELFRETMGVAPLSYLRRWRLTLARAEIERGDRVQAVAERYCYGSTEAISRAIKQEFGKNPRRLRQAALNA